MQQRALDRFDRFARERPAVLPSMMHFRADSVLTVTLGSPPFDLFLACGTFSCRNLLLKVDLHQILDQNWGQWKTHLVMTCDNN